VDERSATDEETTGFDTNDPVNDDLLATIAEVEP
jgi:hypothetical protein